MPESNIISVETRTCQPYLVLSGRVSESLVPDSPLIHTPVKYVLYGRNATLQLVKSEYYDRSLHPHYLQAYISSKVEWLRSMNESYNASRASTSTCQGYLTRSFVDDELKNKRLNVRVSQVFH